MNGRHWHERHYRGLSEIKNLLDSRGFCRVTDDLNDPRFVEKEIKVSSNQIVFMLRPDRLSMNGRSYNPYHVEVTFEKCKIKTMIVVEYISWV